MAQASAHCSAYERHERLERELWVGIPITSRAMCQRNVHHMYRRNLRALVRLDGAESRRSCGISRALPGTIRLQSTALCDSSRNPSWTSNLRGAISHELDLRSRGVVLER